MADIYAGAGNVITIPMVLSDVNGVVDVSTGTVTFLMAVARRSGTINLSGTCTRDTDGTDGAVTFTGTAPTGGGAYSAQCEWVSTNGTISFPNDAYLTGYILPRVGT